MSEREREQMLYGLSAFFVGEERVTSQFSGLVMAAEDKHEEARPPTRSSRSGFRTSSRRRRRRRRA